MIVVQAARRRVANARTVWRKAFVHERVHIGVCWWLFLLSLGSLAASSGGLELFARSGWAFSLGTVLMLVTGSVKDRVVQAAITDEFMSTLRGPSHLHDYADMDYVYVTGVGWRPMARSAD